MPASLYNTFGNMTYSPSLSFPSYAEITARLQKLAREHPDRLHLSSIGTTPEGRSLWRAVLTDWTAGEAEDKPGIWLDGNTHAAELTSSAFCMYVIEHLVSVDLHDPVWGPLLREKAFFVVPRISPDGAEYVLEHRKPLRSAPRIWPERIPPDFERQDLNGNGRTLQMRVERPGGAWRASAIDSRLLIPRAPGDTEGPFYDLFAEGVFTHAENQDEEIRRTTHHGFDFNRNYPHGFRAEGRQRGAGPYPTIHPETRAVIEAFTEALRVSVAATYHTYCGALLRPYSHQGDDKMPRLDLDMYKALGEAGTQATGYPTLSVYEGYTRLLPQVMFGGFDDWAYEERGVFVFTVELWNVAEAAGVSTPDPALFHFLGQKKEDELLAILKWSDAHPHYGGFSDWEPFEHPQLGPVEIGGWDRMGFWQNPPEELVERECEKNLPFIQLLAESTPLLVCEEWETEFLGESLWRVSIRVRNAGYLPTSGSESGECQPEFAQVRAALKMEGDLECVEGPTNQHCASLAGYAAIHQGGWADGINFSGSSVKRTHRFVWVLRGTGFVTVTVDGARGGLLRKAETLEAP